MSMSLMGLILSASPSFPLFLSLTPSSNNDVRTSSWEFLGTPGIGCNQVSINDTANFLQLLKDLRASDLADNATVSATASGLPFVGNDSLPVSILYFALPALTNIRFYYSISSWTYPSSRNTYPP